MAQKNKDKNTEPASDAARADSSGEGATRGDSVDDTRPMKKIAGNETPDELADTVAGSAAAPADAEDPYEADDQWNVEVSHEPDTSAQGHNDDDGDEHDELNWGERWKLTRQFAAMSRSSAVLIISFLLVLLLYLWVKEDPVVTLPSDQPATSETAEPSATTEPSATSEPTGETSAAETSDADPNGTAERSAVPTGTESAAPPTDAQRTADSQVPTRDSSGQSDTQPGGNTGHGGAGEQGTGTGGTGQGGTGAGDGQSETGGTAQGAGTGHGAVAGTGGEEGRNAA